MALSRTRRTQKSTRKRPGRGSRTISKSSRDVEAKLTADLSEARELTPAEHSDPRKARALARYREIGMVRSACLAAGIGRRTWYDWVEEDKLFAAMVSDARQDMADELEAIALKRAKDGSDGMLMFMLKTYRPDKFRERATITPVSPIVREKVARTVQAIRAQLPKELATPLLKMLSEVWQ